MALVVAAAAPGSASPGMAQVRAGVGQESCPQEVVGPDGGWYKVEDLTSVTETVAVPEGYDVDALCYKAATIVRYGADFVVNGDGTVTVTSTVVNKRGLPQAISHVSLHLVAAGTGLTPNECVSQPAGPITPSSAGWQLYGAAEFVEGGLSISSQDFVAGGISAITDFSLQDALNLGFEADTTSVEGVQTVEIVLTTPEGDLHYNRIADNFYSWDPLLPPNPGVGYPYVGTLQDALDTAGNLAVTSVTFVFSTDSFNGVVLTSLSFNCREFTFDTNVSEPS
ncbi:hypothetical protein [Cellulomonas sp. Leaf395]|uniref:hypothetical protein n=1 Tax=Cellulomonas sp. Leaf395 TaxID=1736362 RepID=UPI0012F73924|nr:hypothetical protein [Cellulomonas sp. Leaf395]